MHTRIFFCLLLLSLSFNSAADDLYAAVNRLRAGGADCATIQLPALKPQAALERVAADLARGAKLDQALLRAGYRATQSRFLTIKGDGVGAQAARMLAKQDYCRHLQDASMTETGIYVEARQVWVVMAAPFAPTVKFSQQAAGQRVLELVNRARATARSCGDTAFSAARPMRWSDLLARASLRHSEEMARFNYFSHVGRDGSDPAQRVDRAGYRYRTTGENIAAGQVTPEETVDGWIKSPGHCANIMDSAFTEMGAAFAINAQSDMGIYWTQAFGSR